MLMLPVVLRSLKLLLLVVIVKEREELLLLRWKFLVLPLLHISLHHPFHVSEVLGIERPYT